MYMKLAKKAMGLPCEPTWSPLPHARCFAKGLPSLSGVAADRDQPLAAALETASSASADP